LEHPYWRANDGRKTGLVLITSDRGFCGGLNVALGNAAFSFIKKEKDEGREVEAITAGKKGQVLLRRIGVPLAADFSGIGDHFTLKSISAIARVIDEDYSRGVYGRIYIGFTQFVNTLVQKPIIRELLPFTAETFVEITELRRNGRERQNNSAVYIFEPDVEIVFKELVPHLIEVVIYKAILESRASEHAARMVAMKNATDKAGELIDDLTLAFNQARQAGTTREIAEISAGTSV
jgi:F-type H+-transporting ATPase subunit gamma